MLLTLAFASLPSDFLIDQRNFRGITRTVHLADISREELENYLAFGQKIIGSSPVPSDTSVLRSPHDNSFSSSTGNQTSNFNSGSSSNVSTFSTPQRIDGSDRGHPSVTASSTTTSPGKTPLLGFQQNLAVELPPPLLLGNTSAATSTLVLTSLPTPLSPENLFGPAWDKKLPKWYPNELNKCLSYLNGCLSVEYLLGYFEENWSLIRKDFHLLDTTFDVGSCHLQALINYEIMMRYFSAESQSVPPLVRIYIAICRILSDFENKYGDGSVGYLHCPTHAKRMPEDFPLSKRVDKVSGLSKPIGHSFFAGYLRSIAAAQVLMLLKVDPNMVQPREIKSVGMIPRVPYPLSFDEIIRKMESSRINFCVELVSVSQSPVPGDSALQLRDNHADGIYGDEDAKNRDPAAPMMVFQFCAVGFPDNAILETVMQLRKFPVLQSTLAQTVFLAHGDSQKEPISDDEKNRLQRQIDGYKSFPVSGWLQQALRSDAPRPFADKFKERWILELLKPRESLQESAHQSSGCGLGIRHVYLSTPEQYQNELSERPKIMEQYRQERERHAQEVKERLAARASKATTASPNQGDDDE